jgi:putative ABC transport system permease protein
MSLWRQVVRGLRGLVNPRAADRDVADEVRHYLDEAAAAHMARGLSPADARRAARLECGSATSVRDEVRSYGWENAVGTSLADLRYAARQLRKTPGTTIAAILILGLGVGAITAIFGAVNHVLFEPLPYPQPDRLVMVWDKRGDGGRMTNFATYTALTERARPFEALAVVKPWQPTLTGRAEPERLEGQRVSAAYFGALSVWPSIGRDFRQDDDRFHGPDLAILSDRVWRRRFGGDRAIIGRQVTLDDVAFTVIGVMPRGFENVLAPGADIWAPLQYNPSLPADGREWGHHLRMVGRLRPGASADRARSEMTAMIPELARRLPAGYAVSGGPPDGFIVNLLQADLTADVRPALVAVLGAVTLVLLIACVNVTNLLLARGVQRRGEFAMRAALGAGRMRLVRQVLTESVLLAALGGALGLAIAATGVRALAAVSPPELPRAGATGVDTIVFLFALAVTTLVGVGVGLLPALHACRSGLRAGIQEGSRRAAGNHRWTRGALVVAEVALSLVLLVGAGLLFHSVRRLFVISPGFDASRLLTMQVQESGRRFDSRDARSRFIEQAIEAVRRVPGVEDAAFTGQLPVSGDYDSYGVQFQKDDDADAGPAFRYAVTPRYFETMRIPLRRGRLLDEHDTAGAPVAVVINESFARREFRRQDPIGQRLHVGPDLGHVERPWATIVGVVGDVKQSSLAVGEEDAFYINTTQWPFPDRLLSLVVRARGNAMALAPAVRNAIWSVDKDLPVVRVATMEQLVTTSEARRRFALVVFEAFAVVGLLLAAMGLYGVLSGNVTERTRELGVRSALGASRGDIVALVLRDGMTLTGLGVVAGLGGAALTTRGLVTLLFGISRLDPTTYASVLAVVVAVSAIACGVPAWRASRVDPSVTLRAE